ncbi:hypothetical protein QZH41_011321, partial [Actinostola sp. cb2023]
MPAEDSDSDVTILREQSVSHLVTCRTFKSTIKTEDPVASQSLKFQKVGNQVCKELVDYDRDNLVSVSQSLTQLDSQPVTQLDSQPESQSVIYSAGQSTSQSASQPVTHSTGQSVSQSLTWTVSQRVSQSFTQLDSQPVSQLASQSLTQLDSQSASHSPGQSASQPVTHSVGQSATVRAQVNSLLAVDKELYIGTSWGCILVCNNLTLAVYSVIRSHEETVSYLLPLVSSPVGMHSNSHNSLVMSCGRGYRNIGAGLHGNNPYPSLSQQPRRSGKPLGK